MKRALRQIVALSILAALAWLSSPVPITHAATTRQWPTRLQADATPADITLTRNLNVSINDESGDVVGIGDFNGDRISDFLVSYTKVVHDSDNVLRQRMVKYGIFFGKPDPPEPARINIDKRTPDLTLDFDLTRISFISTVGDVNGDHIDDLMLIERVGDHELGNLRILFGSTRLQPGHLDVAQQTPGIQIINPEPAFAPVAVRVADLNGDGVNDLILADDPFSATRIYGVFGPFASGSTIDLRSPGAGLLITDDSEAGSQVLAPADVNGDGKADILLARSAPAPATGIKPLQLDIVFGAATLPSGREVSLTDGQADATVDIGFIVGGLAAGDINGDGSADILIGHTARFDGGPPLTAGWVDVIFGSRALHGHVAHVDVQISGLPPRPSAPGLVDQASLVRHLGASIVVQDLNGDGFADMVLGTLGVQDSDREESLSPGRTHVIFGSADFGDVRLEKEEQDLTIIFGNNQRGSGSPVNVGDFNGDGLGDVLVNGIDISVYFGAPLRPPQITQAKYNSNTEDLTLTGMDFTGAARVEINGVDLDLQAAFRPEQGQLVVHGSRAQLNLRDGKNQAVLTRKGVRSNAVKIKVKG
ncbi:MAG TPA: VCBS repeat-containing protein [Blastocatellia bacterium]|nr:VCBS repeat-containing protein [Blastocatellia bacterium]